MSFDNPHVAFNGATRTIFFRARGEEIHATTGVLQLPLEACFISSGNLMKSVQTFLIELRESGIHLWVDQGQLNFRALNGALNAYQRDSIRSRKAEIMEFLNQTRSMVRESLASAPTRLVPQERVGPVPLSFAQQRLWFVDQLDHSAGAAYHMAAGLQLRGHLNISALRAALDRVVARHETLRTAFVSINGEPAQIIAPDDSGFSLSENDLTDLCDAEQKAAVESLCDDEFTEPFNLETGPLFRGRLLTISAQEHILLFTQHHIISDGWSVGILMNEVSALYTAFAQARADALPLLPVQYADYAIWQRRWLTREALQKQASYWRETLTGAPALCELPTDRARPSRQSFAGDLVPCVLDANLTDRLKSFSQRHGCTMFMALLASWVALLSRLCGQTDITVGTPTANRPQKEIEGLIGFFVNTLALRLDVSSPTTIAQLMSRVRMQALSAQMNQDIPFEQVVEALRPLRSLSHSALFQVFFAWEQGAVERVNLPGLSLTTFAPKRHLTAKFDLTLALGEVDDRIEGCIEFATALFDRSTIERYVKYWHCLLEDMLVNDEQAIDKLNLLPVSERRCLVEQWNGAEISYQKDKCIHELFEAHAEAAPHAEAIVWGSSSLTYGELNARANRLAHYLRDLGVKPDVRVAICVERSLEMVICVLAVLKAGGAYVPLDPAYPLERLAHMISDSAPVSILTSSSTSGIVAEISRNSTQTPRAIDVEASLELWATQPCSNPGYANAGPGSRNLAYVIYTSGSTSASRGVCVEHGQISAMGAAWKAIYHLRPALSHLQMASFSFDVFTGDLVRALCFGGRLVLCPREALLDGSQLWRLIEDKDIKIGEFVPVVLREFTTFLNSAGKTLSRMEIVICGSDVWTPEDARRLRTASGPHTRNVNSYGLTEASVDSAYFEITEENIKDLAVIPIGRPLPNARIYILDQHFQPVPIGVIGEIFVGGGGVARGYLNRAELTSKLFLKDPFSSNAHARVYRTGDLGRFLPDGNIEFRGRNDFQVKIRGFRIELEEIEARLSEYPGIKELVVIAREDAPGEKRLVAYFVSENDVDIEAAREHLRRLLPEHMIPAAYVRLTAMPSTPNGKIDRKQLPVPDGDAYARASYEAPKGEIEEGLTQIWVELLKIDMVSRYDNFFELGGHSLLAMQLVNRIRSNFDVELPLRCLFEAPTIFDLSSRIDAGRQHTARSKLPALRKREHSEVIPLSFAQERLLFVQQLEGVSANFNIPIALRLSGEIDSTALEMTLGDLLERHESLRTIFAISPKNEGQQIVLEPAHARPRMERSEATRHELTQALANAAACPFDLTLEIPIRVHLYRISALEHVLLIVLHHIASDAWSLAPLTRDFVHAYTKRCGGKNPDWTPLAIQYADYAVWERRVFGSLEDPESLLARQVTYWQKQLKNLPTQVVLPPDFRRSASPSSRGDAVLFRISRDTHQQLTALAREHRVTLFMLLHACVAALLTRLGAGTDIPIGTSVARRPTDELDDVVGVFVNLLVLRTDTSGNPCFNELLTRVRETNLAAYENQDLPFERVVEFVNPIRTRVHHPLFQTTVVLHNTSKEAIGLPKLAVALEEVPNPIALFDLALHFAETLDGAGMPNGIHAHAGYSSDLYKRSTIETFVARLFRMFDSVIADATQRIGRFELRVDSALRLELAGASEAQELLHPGRSIAARDGA